MEQKVTTCGVKSRILSVSGICLDRRYVNFLIARVVDPGPGPDPAAKKKSDPI